MTEHPFRTHPIWRWLAGALVLGAIAAFFVLQQIGRQHEVRDMPESERRALYQRTLETLMSTCGNGVGPTMKEHCRNQAEFIALFPECGDTCRARVLQLTSSPAR